MVVRMLSNGLLKQAQRAIEREDEMKRIMAWHGSPCMLSKKEKIDQKKKKRHRYPPCVSCRIHDYYY